MSAQTGRALEIPNQQTPVIVKNGGGTKDTSVIIESPVMAFVESVPGLTWESSQSTLTGRIIELTIVDGKKPPQDYPITPSDQLATVRIEYGLAQLQFIESGNPVAKNVVLVITSAGVSFSVPQEGGWKDATATFPERITRVTFMVGNEVVTRQEFIDPDADITFNIQFFRNTD